MKLSASDAQLISDLKASGLDREASDLLRALRCEGVIPNPARARRETYRREPYIKRVDLGDGEFEEYEDVRSVWGQIDPYLTADHQESLTEEAKSASSRAIRFASGQQVRGVHRLGRGNFGEVFSVDMGDKRIFAVKIPAETNVHGRPWTEAEKRDNLLHEAGVANELRELGYGIVPDVYYVESADGTPSIVREYGDPVEALTPREFYDVEVQLVAIENEGWGVEDTIDLYRREDGSIFIADVGIWHPDTIREGSPSKSSSSKSSLDSHLLGLLQELGKRMLPGNPKRIATLPWLMTIMSHLERAIVEDKSDRILQMMVEKAQEDIEKRTDLGLPVPEEFITLTQRAIDILES